MKQIASLVFVLLFAISGASAKDRVSPHTTVQGNNITITYGQPSMKGRLIFGDLVPWGQVWRTGADEATEITFAKDCTFAGKKVKAGTYTLFTTPGQNAWGIILNSKLGQWGSFDYEKNKAADVVNTAIRPKFIQDQKETLTFTVTTEGIKMEWASVVLMIPVQFQ